MAINPVYTEDEIQGLQTDEETVKLLSPKSNVEYTQPTSRYLYLLVLFAALGGFLFGYDTGVISGAMIPLKRKFHLSYEMQEVIVSMTLVGAMLGASSSAYLNEKFGRRVVLLIASFLFTLGSVFMAAANIVPLIVIGRFLVGLGIGYASMTVPIYVAEMSPSHIRGKLVTMNQLLITFGIFMAALMNGLFSYIPGNGWRYMLGISAVPSVIMFVGFLFMPESPRWLIINNQGEKAKHVLQLIRGQTDVEEEFQQISLMVTPHSSESFIATLRNILNDQSARRALFIGCCLQAFQQLSAINTVMYYSATIIEMAGVEDQTTILWMAAAVALGNFVATLISINFIEKVSRRRLMLLSLFGVCLGLCLLATTFFLIKRNSTAVTSPMVTSNARCESYRNCYDCIGDQFCGFCYSQNGSMILKSACMLANNSSIDSSVCVSAFNSTVGDIKFSTTTCPTSFAWIAVFAMVFYLIMFAPGVGPLPWAINAEIFPLWARNVGVAASTTTNWTFNLLVSLTFLNVVQLLTECWTFVLYAICSFVGVVIFFLFLPETKGVKLERVHELFEGSIFVPFKKNTNR